MSLEVAIKENTEAVKALHALLAGSQLGAVVASAKAAPAPAAAPAAPAKEAPKPEPKAPEQTTSAPATTTALNYEKDIKPIALALAKKSREKLTEIWGKLGVKVGTELKPEQFAQAKALIEEASK